MYSFRNPIGVTLVGVVTLTLSAVVFAPSASAAPSAQDTAFAMSNEQVNLAEITIGTIALQRATSPVARALATMTISDHQKAKTKLTALAATEHITLPTAPNTQQQSQAATLKSVSAPAFDLTYAQIQVAGHQMSIAATNTEIAAGMDASVTAYANYYLPVATMHLNMAQSAVVALGGTPTGVPAGSGGQAATTSLATVRYAWAGIIAGMLMLAAVAMITVRRRTAASR